MKTFYHCLIMWVPFIVLFAFAGLGLEVFEGNKINSETSIDLGILGTLFIMGSIAFIFYLVSFFPLTFVVTKFVKVFLTKSVIFTLSGGVIGVLAFLGYGSNFIEEYNLNIVSAFFIFSLAGLLYALTENAVKRNIKFS